MMARAGVTGGILRRMPGDRLSRRELLGAGAAAGAVLALQRTAPAAAATERTLEFAALGDGDGWPAWRCAGVANLRRGGGQGLLEAASDVFPCDPRPVAFALDQRFRDGEVVAVVNAGGAGTGVVLRRTGPRDYYAAILDDEQRALVIVRRSPAGVTELGRAPAEASGAFQLSLRATGARPTHLEATLAGGPSVSARDAAPALQRAGDPGVLATARTLYPSAGPAVLPALGNLHLLPYGVQEGEAFMQTGVGQQVLAAIRERSTAAFTRIVVRSAERPAPTAPSVAAATTGAPHAGGAALRVAADIPALVEIEMSADRGFRDSRRIRAGRTGAFDAVLARATGLTPGRRVYWRARLHRQGRET